MAHKIPTTLRAHMSNQFPQLKCSTIPLLSTFVISIYLLYVIYGNGRLMFTSKTNRPTSWGPTPTQIFACNRRVDIIELLRACATNQDSVSKLNLLKKCTTSRCTPSPVKLSSCIVVDPLLPSFLINCGLYWGELIPVIPNTDGKSVRQTGHERACLSHSLQHDL